MNTIIQYPEKGGRGFLIGAGTGIVLGALVGIASAPPIDNSSFGSSIGTSIGREAAPYGGALIGFLAGGIIGVALGSAQSFSLHINFRGYTEDEKKNKLALIAKPWREVFDLKDQVN